MILLEETCKYRCETEKEAEELFSTAREHQREENYEITKSSIVMKTKKSKGEIIDLWYLATLTKKYGGNE